MSFGVDEENKFLQHSSVNKNRSPLEETAKGRCVLLKEAATEQNCWPMAKIVATNAGKNGFVISVKLMLGASGTTDTTFQYPEQPVNKLVMLMEMND